MFLKNAWYCAGWDYQLTQGKNALLSRKIAGKRVVLYRKTDGAVVAMEDMCPHRQAALSLGRKEGDSLRCMYHGLKFDQTGQCTEVPGQTRIPPKACVRVFPVVEKDNWIWVWMGDPTKADPELICHSVGPGDPNFNIKASHIEIEANYRLEHANLADLTHSSFTHANTFAMDWGQVHAKPVHKVIPRGIKTDIWVRKAPPPVFARHMFPPGFLCDAHFDITQTVPLNWIMHFRVFTAGTATEGDSDGQLVLDTWTCQAVTPRDETSVDYYYSWGASKATEQPGLSETLKEAIDEAFAEDRQTLEAQQRNILENPGFETIDIAADAGPGRILWVLDKMLADEAKGEPVPA